MADGATMNDCLDIEARQDELLRQLDELNHRVERALVALIGERSTSEGVAGLLPAARLHKPARAA